MSGLSGRPLDGLRGWLGDVGRLLTRGRRHRRRLEELDVRVAVTGTRGKTTTVGWLHDVLTDRGYDTYSKTTGQRPLSLYNDEVCEIERSGRVTLYENEREIRKYDPEDAIVVENQGIREYTTRLVNARYVKPQVTVLTNVRLDHLDTLGTDYREIAVALARSIPSGTRVICGEGNEAITAYLDRELARRDVPLRTVSPDEATAVPGAELVAVLDATLEAIGETPLSGAERERYLSRLEVDWRRLPGGRVHFAADTNDVDSTELIRRALQGKTAEVIDPLVYFRRDRPGRTAAYVEYLDGLAGNDLVGTVHVVGHHREATARKLDAPVVAHDEEAVEPGEVLDAALSGGRPVLVMGNSTPEFVGELRAEIRHRTVEPPGEEGVALAPEDGDADRLVEH